MNTKAQLSRWQQELQQPDLFDRTENSLFSIDGDKRAGSGLDMNQLDTSFDKDSTS